MNNKAYKVIVIILMIFQIFTLALLLVSLKLNKNYKAVIKYEYNANINNNIKNEDLNGYNVIKSYEDLIKICPYRIDAYFYLSKVYEKKHDYDKAIEILQTGMDNSKDKARSVDFLYLGRYNIKNNDLNRAIEMLNIAKRYAKYIPEKVNVHFYFSQVYTLQNNKDKACKELLMLNSYRKISKYMKYHDRIFKYADEYYQEMKCDKFETENTLLDSRKSK
ncbi:MAG: hypothetical protein WCX65_17060 [bacterium]